uniref:RdRp n=1 Tax=Hubei reo-like virus 5 TaxID=1923180 RepID=A0A1L3KP94_9VIRU|nr:RdRp [Hubei reo-like virus 5]
MTVKYQTILEILTHLDYNPDQELNYFLDLQEIDNRDDLFHYLKDYPPIQDKEIVSGLTSSNSDYSFTFSVPDYITNPPPYDPSIYTPDSDGKSFTSPDQIRYLATFDVNDFYTKFEQNSDSKEHRLTAFLLEKSSNQSRVSDIWRQSLACALASEAFIQREINELWQPNRLAKPSRTEAQKMNPLLLSENPNPIRRCYSTLLRHYHKIPVREKGKTLIWERNITNSLSILPLLLYGISTLTTMMMTEILTPVEVYLSFNLYLELGEKAFQDSKLKIQKHLTSWLKEIGEKLPTTLVPGWNVNGYLGPMRWHATTEPILVKEEIRTKKEKREKVIPEYMRSYLKCNEKAMSQNVDYCMRIYAAMRVMSNDGTYFSSHPSLIMEQTSAPQVKEHLVPALQPTSTLKGLTLHSLVPKHSILDHMNKFAELYLEGTVAHLKGKCMEELFIKFLTTSSSGKEFLETEIGHFSKSVQKKSSTRVIAAAVQSHEFFNLRAIREDINRPAKLLQRYQIKRRARVVFGVSNIVSMVAFPALVVLEEHQKLTGCASSGKQYGDYKDVLDYLSCYGFRYFLFNSSDVSGMDASVQANLPQFMWNFVTTVCEQLSPYIQYFAFAPSNEFIEIVDNDGLPEKVIRRMISGLVAVCVEARNMIYPQNAVTDDDIMGVLTTRDPTFPSGLPYTNVHHTFVLSCAIKGLINYYADNHRCFPHSLLKLKVQGDDVAQLLYGVIENVQPTLSIGMEGIKRIGLEVETDCSKNIVEFLQQMTFCGRYLGYPDRISLFTSERPREGKNFKEKMSEVCSLAFDLGNRVRNPEGLVTLLYAIGMVCCSRMTFRTSTSAGKKLINSQNGKILHARFLFNEHNEIEQRADGFIRAYLPIYALWSQHGLLPPLSTPRRDGTFTPKPTHYHQRGSMNRRWMYDLSNNILSWTRGYVKARIDPEGIRVSDFLDLELLSRYHVNLTDILLDRDRKESLTDLRLADEHTVNSIKHLSTLLDSMRNPFLLSRSAMAYSRLMQAGIKIPERLVSAKHSEYRMLEAVISATSEKTEDLSMGDELIETIIKAKDYVKTKATDVCLLYFFVPNNDIQCKFNDTLTSTLATVSLSQEVWPGSNIAVLTKYLGIKSNTEYTHIQNANILRGRYGPSQMREEIFQEGLKIYRSHSKHIEDFFDACSIPWGERADLLKAYENYNTVSHLQFISQNIPRQMFFTSANSREVLKYVDFKHENDQASIILDLASLISTAEICSRAHSLNENSWTLRMVPSCLYRG